MIEWFIATITTSTVAQGVFAGAIATAPLAVLLWLVKDFPKTLFNYVMNFLRKEITFLSTMDDYEDLVHYIQDYVKWSRHKTLMEDNIVTLGYGSHYGKYNGVYFKLVKKLEESNDSYNFKERTSIYFYEIRDKTIPKYVKSAIKCKKRDLKVYTNANHGWDCSGRVPPRRLETVYFDHKQQIVDHINAFTEQENLYEERGMPYHTGILLHGIPGTGKTSLIKAIANKFNKDIYILNPASLKKGGLGDLFYNDWKDRLLVIEDIDVSGITVDRKTGEPMSNASTLSELLNALDGITTPHGMVTIATTNNIEALDTALTRPGRFDLVLEVGKLSEAEAQRMAQAFNQELHDYTPMTGAELRQKFLKNNS